MAQGIDLVRCRADRRGHRARTRLRRQLGEDHAAVMRTDPASRARFGRLSVVKATALWFTLAHS